MVLTSKSRVKRVLAELRFLSVTCTIHSITNDIKSSDGDAVIDVKIKAVT